MKTNNKIQLNLENFEKCVALVDSDCPLGQLFDFSCALKSFVMQKLQELESASKVEEKIEE
jgi:hypothetical protein